MAWAVLYFLRCLSSCYSLRLRWNLVTRVPVVLGLTIVLAITTAGMAVITEAIMAAAANERPERLVATAELAPAGVCNR